jgi:CRISPR/Cas system CMR-associated protein Cmr3 (group 5 of RAMP superfamily)
MQLKKTKDYSQNVGQKQNTIFPPQYIFFSLRKNISQKFQQFCTDNIIK